MIMKPTRLLLACAALAFASTASLHAAPAIGSDAPSFSLSDSDGKKHTLAEHKGKYVVLEWTNPQCPFVKKHYGSGNMQKLQAEYTKKGVVWLSIDSSAKGHEGYLTPEQAKEWQATAKTASTALLLDADGKVGREYGAKTTPEMYIINPEGKLVYSGAIDSIPSADPSDVTKASNYVKAGLDSALSGKPIETAATKSYGCSVKYE